MTVQSHVAFYRAEDYQPEHAGDAHRIAGWVGYTRTVHGLHGERKIEAMVPVWTGATCELAGHHS